MTEYIKSLREMVGTRPLMQCGATVVVFDQTNRILMLRRTDNGCWCFPGGSIELGERVEDAARREVLEEAGISVGALKLLQVFSGPELYYRYPHGDEVYNVDIVYSTRESSGAISINDESRDYHFFELDEIPDDVSPPQVPIVEYLRRGDTV